MFFAIKSFLFLRVHEDLHVVPIKDLHHLVSKLWLLKIGYLSSYIYLLNLRFKKIRPFNCFMLSEVTIHKKRNKFCTSSIGFLSIFCHCFCFRIFFRSFLEIFCIFFLFFVFLFNLSLFMKKTRELLQFTA